MSVTATRHPPNTHMCELARLNLSQLRPKRVNMSGRPNPVSPVSARAPLSHLMSPNRTKPALLTPSCLSWQPPSQTSANQTLSAHLHIYPSSPHECHVSNVMFSKPGLRLAVPPARPQTQTNFAACCSASPPAHSTHPPPLTPNLRWSSSQNAQWYEGLRPVRFTSISKWSN